ncbi:MAG: hypothetical protein R2758_08475 [Bacteroidales bacterium]
MLTRVVDGDTFWVDDGSEKGLKYGSRIDALAMQAQGPRIFRAGTHYLRDLLRKRVRLEFDLQSMTGTGEHWHMPGLKTALINAELVKMVINGDDSAA